MQVEGTLLGYIENVEWHEMIEPDRYNEVWLSLFDQVELLGLCKQGDHIDAIALTEPLVDPESNVINAEKDDVHIMI
jgi:hypothetical protein